MTMNFTCEKRRGVRAISTRRRLSDSHDGTQKPLRIIYHCLKYSTGALKLLNGTFQHRAIGTQVLEEGGLILRAFFDVTEQRHCGADSPMCGSKLCGAVAVQWRQSKELSRSPLVNFCQEAVSVLGENKNVFHALECQKLMVIGHLKAVECKVCVGLIVEMLKIHSGSSQACNCRCIVSPPSIFTRRNPQCSDQSTCCSYCCDPIRPLRHSEFRPRYRVEREVSKLNNYPKDADASKQPPGPVQRFARSNQWLPINKLFLNHDFLGFNWRNSNTLSIGGGK